MVSITLRQLEYFGATAQAGTVSGAARACHTSQAAVSTALKELERALGLQLFIRQTAKGMTLTRSGSRTLAVARRILGDAAELEDLAGAEHEDAAGPLHVASTFALSPRILPALAAAAADRYPLVTLSLVDGLAEPMQRLVLDGRADACLLYGRQAIPGLDVKVVREIEPFLVVPAGHRLAAAGQAMLRELLDEPLILIDPEGSRGVIQAVLDEAGVIPRLGPAFTNPETVRAMVARGLGYSIFSGRPASTETFDGGRVAYVHIADPITRNTVVIATPHGQQPTARTKALFALLMTSEVQAALG